MTAPVASDPAATRFAEAFGHPLMTHWHAVGRDAQRLIFDQAAANRERSGDFGFREALAVFLHDHHPRTGSD